MTTANQTGKKCECCAAPATRAPDLGNGGSDAYLCEPCYAAGTSEADQVAAEPREACCDCGGSTPINLQPCVPCRERDESYGEVPVEDDAIYVDPIDGKYPEQKLATLADAERWAKSVYGPFLSIVHDDDGIAFFARPSGETVAEVYRLNCGRPESI